MGNQECRVKLAIVKVCDNRQGCNSYKGSCECKELINKGRCDYLDLINHECDKSCDIGKCLDYKNCKYRGKLIDKLVLECEDEILNTN